MTMGSIEQMFGIVKGVSTKIPENIVEVATPYGPYAVRILQGTEEEAYNELKALGFEGESPVSASELARFYGVTQQYMNRVFMRLKIGPRLTPGLFRKEFGTTLIDPRIALVSCMVMLHGKTVPIDQRVSQCRKQVEHGYYKDALASEESEKQAELMANRAEAAKGNGVFVSNDGMYMMTPEFFQKIVEHVAKEAVRAAIAETTAPTVTADEPQEKQPRCGHDTRAKEKPKNWEKIVGLQEEGKLTHKEAALVCNMSPASFYRHKTIGFKEDCKC